MEMSSEPGSAKGSLKPMYFSTPLLILSALIYLPVAEFGWERVAFVVSGD